MASGEGCQRGVDAAAPALLGFVTVSAVAFARGSYFETAWGWSALALLWVAVVALLVVPHIGLAWQEVFYLGGVFGVGALAVPSSFWGSSVTEAVREGQRTTIYVAAVVCGLLVVTRTTSRFFLIGIWFACSVVSTYALATRLFAPDPGDTDGYRLATPIGYWNALGVFAAMGVLLSLGVISRARGLALSAVAAAAVVPLVTTMYFTFGRGPWLALIVGLIGAVALDPRRLQLILFGLLVSVPATIAVWLAWHSHALTHQGSPLVAAEREGRDLAVAIVVLSCVSAAIALSVRALERRVTVGRPARVAFAAAVVLGLVVAFAGLFARQGGPLTLAERGYANLTAPPPSTNGNLNERLFDLSSRGRVEQWRVAWEDVNDHRLLGSGAGSYERYWDQHRPHPGPVRDAHSLYLEMLAELGPLGLGLLVLAFVAPLAAAFQARHNPYVPAATGAYVGYLAHAAVDWDWEMPAVTLTALFCGCAILVAARRPANMITLSPRMRVGAIAATLALSAFAFVGLIGNQAIAANRAHVRAGEWEDAKAEARTAIRWKPWSSEGWAQLAEAQLGGDDLAGARASYKKALEKDSNDWNLWFDYGLLSRGRERRQAIARARELNPLSPEIAVTLEALRRTTKRPTTTGK